MKWFDIDYDALKGTLRVVRKFLICPRRWGRESRWLEYADIVEQFTPSWPCKECRQGYWKEIGFADPIQPHLETIEKQMKELQK
jgi:hypothetical protein